VEDVEVGHNGQSRRGKGRIAKMWIDVRIQHEPPRPKNKKDRKQNKNVPQNPNVPQKNLEKNQQQKNLEEQISNEIGTGNTRREDRAAIKGQDSKNKKDRKQNKNAPQNPNVLQKNLEEKSATGKISKKNQQRNRNRQHQERRQSSKNPQRQVQQPSPNFVSRPYTTRNWVL
jgi:hypothetical protein